MKKAFGLAGIVLLLAGLASCGGGGGGGGGVPLSPPAFTNLGGTPWNQTDAVTASNTCGVGIGVTDTYVLKVLVQSGNTISIYDETLSYSGSGTITSLDNGCTVPIHITANKI